MKKVWGEDEEDVQVSFNKHIFRGIKLNYI